MTNKLGPLGKRELNTAFFPYQMSTEISLLHGKLTVPELVNRLIRVNKKLQAHTSLPFVFWGGMALYTYLLDIGLYDYNLIHQRTHNGKNDFDVGVSITEISQIMDDFEWGETEKRNQTGRIRPGWETIDVMVREKLPSFPPQEVKIDGCVLTLATPEEMVLQKLQTMANNDEAWPDKPGEVKWAIDVRLLKTYLCKSLGLNRLELEEYLKEKWETYIREKNNMSREKQYQIIDRITTRIQNGLSTKSGIKEYFKIRFGGADFNVEEQLMVVFGQNEEANIQALIMSKNAHEFGRTFKKIIQGSYKYSTYDYTLARAEKSYTNLLPKRLIRDYSNLSKLDVQLDKA